MDLYDGIPGYDDIQGDDDIPGEEGDLLARTDPIDVAHLTASWTASSASSALFEEITTAAATDHHPGATLDEPAGGEPDPAVLPIRRGRGRRGVWAAAAAVVAVAAVAVDLWPGSAPAAYAVHQRRDGVIQVDWQGDLRDGDALTRELRGYGLDIAVEVLPSSPSAVGRVIVATLDDFEPGGPLPAGVSWGDDGADDVFTWTIDPSVFRGSITVELAVAAKPGERYVVAEEVFEPGEVLGGLHCTLASPLRAGDVAAHVGEDLRLRWFVVELVDPADPDLVRNTEVGDVPEGEVLWGYAEDGATVALTVRPDGVDLGPNVEPRLSDVPC